MSYLGSIGHIINGSGLADLWERVKIMPKAQWCICSQVMPLSSSAVRYSDLARPYTCTFRRCRLGNQYWQRRYDQSVSRHSITRSTSRYSWQWNSATLWPASCSRPGQNCHGEPYREVVGAIRVSSITDVKVHPSRANRWLTASPPLRGGKDTSFSCSSSSPVCQILPAADE